ncbi:MAG TPA: hypothetical protein VEY67_11335, partial [Candidatus Dormibacteraeota bacterium]|nr:hypothetical protein [Candidatus Dormibacteraeota bacterium]
LTLHLKRGIDADVDGSARVVTEEPERRRVLEKIARAWGRADIDAMDRFSPLIEVRVDAARTGRAAA